MSLFPMTQTAALVGQLIDTKASTVPIIEMTSFKPEYDFLVHSSRLDRCTPEEEGVPSSLVSELLEKMRSDKTLNLHSITIARNGRILCEASLGAQRLDIWKHAFSASKSVTSLAIGILIDDGVLRLDEKVVSIFREEVGAVAKLKLKDLRVEDLLTMRSTVLFAEADSMTDDDWVKAFLNASTKGEIGESFRYNSLNTYMLSAIVTKKTGKSMSEFLNDRLFAPLGIKDYYWEKCPKGMDKGGWGLYIRPEDFVKIGTLVVNGGEYNGERIVSAEYINMATMKHVDIGWESDSFDYGYQIWVGKKSNTILFNGMLGQNVLCFKDSGIVVVSNAGNSDMFQQSSFFTYLDNYFNRDFADRLESAPRDYKKLCKQIASYSLYGKKKFALRKRLSALLLPQNKKVSYDALVGKEYSILDGDEKAIGIIPLVIQSVENCYTKGLVGVSFAKNSDGAPELIYKEDDGDVHIRLGFDKPEIFNIKYRNENFIISSKAKFTQNEDGEAVLVIRLDFIETPSSRIIKIYFQDDGTLVFEQTEAPGADFMIGLTDMVLTQLIDRPIVGAVFEKFGAGFIEYKIQKVFNAKLTLKQK